MPSALMLWLFELASMAARLPGRLPLPSDNPPPLAPPVPEYKHPGKKWRLKRGATPQWYKARHGVRRQVQSGAARVARFRPKNK